MWTNSSIVRFSKLKLTGIGRRRLQFPTLQKRSPKPHSTTPHTTETWECPAISFPSLPIIRSALQTRWLPLPRSPRGWCSVTRPLMKRSLLIQPHRWRSRPKRNLITRLNHHSLPTSKTRLNAWTCSSKFTDQQEWALRSGSCLMQSSRRKPIHRWRD